MLKVVDLINVRNLFRCTYVYVRPKFISYCVKKTQYIGVPKPNIVADPGGEGGDRGDCRPPVLKKRFFQIELKNSINHSKNTIII